MKNFLIALVLTVPLALAGCKAATAPAQPLAPGYQNAADQQMGQILSGARAFYSTIQCETQGLNWSQATSQCVADPAITSPLVLSATVKTAFNDFGASLNAANTVYLAYHANPTAATQTAAQTAVNAVQQQQAALPIPGAK